MKFQYQVKDNSTLVIKLVNFKMLKYVCFIQQDNQENVTVGFQTTITTKHCMKYFMLIHKLKECPFSSLHF